MPRRKGTLNTPQKIIDEIVRKHHEGESIKSLAENFFSILKTECIYRAKLQTYEEARLLIGEYIHFYNNQRIQLKTKQTPLEKRSQYVA